MADSKAKKMRQKRVREGKRNPDQNRSPFVNCDMRLRVGKGKKDTIYQHKYKELSSNYDNGSFLLYRKLGIQVSVDKFVDKSSLAG